jgi:hypothetical protein
MKEVRGVEITKIRTLVGQPQQNLQEHMVLFIAEKFNTSQRQ